MRYESSANQCNPATPPTSNTKGPLRSAQHLTHNIKHPTRISVPGVRVRLRSLAL